MYHSKFLVGLALLVVSSAAFAHGRLEAALGSSSAGQQIPSTMYECTAPFCTALPTSMQTAIQQHAAPGITAAVVGVGSGLTDGKNTGPAHDVRSGDEAPSVLFLGSSGRFTYDEQSAEMTNETLFDMASCTKVITVTTAAAQLYQKGLLGLEDPVVKYLPGFGGQGKATITVRNLLLHNAGFPPDPNPGFSSPLFPCPENTQYYPAQRRSCEALIYSSVLNQTLENEPGAVYVYSDLSFMTLMYVVGALVQTTYGSTLKMRAPCFDPSSLTCNFHAYVVQNVFEAYGMNTAKFCPNNPLLTPPQWFDPWYHHGQIMGYVSDQNAYANGGIFGHAGLFASVTDAMALMKRWLFATANDTSLNSTTVALWTRVANITQSARALGWDTNQQANPSCGSLSPTTFLHLGFTGTQLCADPVRQVFTVLLANGRYPQYRVDGMIGYRPVFNTLVASLVG